MDTMTNSVNNNNQGGVGMLGWLRGKFVPLLGLLLVVAITVGIFYFYRNYPGRIEELKTYGYLGAFVLSVIFNATLILPAGNMLIMVALAATMPSPVLVGLVGGLGASIGEISGYVAGRSGRGLVTKSQMYNRVEGWLQRWGWLTIFLFSVVPFVFDLAGLAAGALRYPFWRFFIFCWLGRTLLYVVMVTAVAYGLKIWMPWLG
jgi:membrane protein DedA with SNARE-associated domain